MKKKNLFIRKFKSFVMLSIIISFGNTVNAQAWTKKADFGGGERSGAISFSIVDKIYIGLGYNYFDSPQYKKDFWEYDPVTDIWTQKADYIGVIKSRPAYFAIGNKGYCCIGCDTCYDLWEYDTSTNIWTRKSDFIGPARVGSVSFAIGNKGYLGTGFINGNYLKDFWEYDALTDMWSHKSDFGGTERSSAVGISTVNKGYIGTGFYLNNSFKDFWEYDPSNDIWTKKTDFGGSARSNAVGFSIGSNVYIGTGSGTNYNYLKDIWEYNANTDSWFQKANFGGNYRSSAIGVSVNSKGYIGTGYYFNSNPYYLKDFREYNPNNDTTGMLEPDIKNKLYFFNDNFNLKIGMANNLKKVLIMDSLGNEIVQCNNICANNKTINISALNHGIYIAKIITNNNNIIVKKFIKI